MKVWWSVQSTDGALSLYAALTKYVALSTLCGSIILWDSSTLWGSNSMEVPVEGVRLDLNEVQVSLKRTDENEPVAFGRELFTSVFDALSSNAANALGINLAASEVIKEMVTILMRQSQRVPLRPSHLSGIDADSMLQFLILVQTYNASTFIFIHRFDQALGQEPK